MQINSGGKWIQGKYRKPCIGVNATRNRYFPILPLRQAYFFQNTWIFDIRSTAEPSGFFDTICFRKPACDDYLLSEMQIKVFL